MLVTSEVAGFSLVSLRDEWRANNEILFNYFDTG
jgi:hypothetical protein